MNYDMARLLSSFSLSKNLVIPAAYLSYPEEKEKALSRSPEQGLFDLSSFDRSEHGHRLTADHDDEAHHENPDDHQGGGGILDNRNHPRLGMGEKG